ncbi:MAG TPA: hypothetical protein VHK65_18445 [Candidatus Dormibacteraeota bacterium]|nr:hypothetical protein [Candidatus Dormibacteraeota bacterium]
MPGPYGWGGAAFVVASLASQVAASLFLLLIVVNRDGHLVIPLIICFVLAFPLLGAALVLWRIGMKRAGTLHPSSMAKERQRPASSDYRRNTKRSFLSHSV